MCWLRIFLRIARFRNSLTAFSQNVNPTSLVKSINNSDINSYIDATNLILPSDTVHQIIQWKGLINSTSNGQSASVPLKIVVHPWCRNWGSSHPWCSRLNLRIRQCYLHDRQCRIRTRKYSHWDGLCNLSPNQKWVWTHSDFSECLFIFITSARTY